MRIGVLSLAVWTVVALFGGASVARADSATATCELHKDGKYFKNASGPCRFSQRQGYIDLVLRNGDSYSLTPTGTEGQYRDQKGAKGASPRSGCSTRPPMCARRRGRPGGCSR